MALTIQQLARQLNLPVTEVIRQLEYVGIKGKTHEQAELSEAELQQFQTLRSLYLNSSGDVKERKALDDIKDRVVRYLNGGKESSGKGALDEVNALVTAFRHKYLQGKNDKWQAMDALVATLQQKYLGAEQPTIDDGGVDAVIANGELVFLTLSALMQPASATMLQRLYASLKRRGKKAILPYNAYTAYERRRLLGTVDAETTTALVQLHKNECLDIYGDKQTDDAVFLAQLERLRMTRQVLVITNEPLTLGARGREVRQYRVSSRGLLKPLSVTVTNELPRPTPPKQTVVDKFTLATTLAQVPTMTMESRQAIKEGMYVSTAGKKQNVYLKRELGSGGEGTVYATNDANVVAKIYKKDKLTAEKFHKLKLMVSKPIREPGICYPLELLYNDFNEFIGYTMPAAKGKELRHVLFLPKKVFEQNYAQWTRRDLVQLAIVILEKIHFLHERNVVLGDINPFNILVVSKREICFVDVDSYQIEGYPCPVGTDNFTAPEIQGQNFKQFLRSFGHEYFAVATLLFNILFLGKSPYSQTGGETNAANIKRMEFPYPYGANARTDLTPKGQWRYIWANLPPYLQEAFYRTFQREQSYSSERTRINAAAWLKIMRQYERDLTAGPFIQEDGIVNEIYPNRVRVTGEARKDLRKCSACHLDYPSFQLVKGICQSCMHKGEEYRCAGCNKELIFTNYEKHILQQTKRKKYCRDCK